MYRHVTGASGFCRSAASAPLSGAVGSSSDSRDEERYRAVGREAELSAFYKNRWPPVTCYTWRVSTHKVVLGTTGPVEPFARTFR